MPEFPIENDPNYDKERDQYGSPAPSRDYIHQVLTQLDKPTSCKTLCKLFGIRGETLTEAVRRRLIAMRRDGQLLMDSRGRFAHLASTDMKEECFKGLVVGHPDGFGWVDSKEFPTSIRLNETQMQQVFPGDIVMVSLVDPTRERPNGRIQEIVRHHTWMLKGIYQIDPAHPTQAFVTPENKEHAYHKIPVTHDPQLPSGTRVQVEILTQPSSPQGMTAQVVPIPVLDTAIEFALDQARHLYHLPREFPESVLKASENIDPEHYHQNKDNIARRDLRHLHFVTIDGEDAKDFDDAVYAESKKSGGWRLFVAIADVSYFVRPNDTLDIEAQKRSTSNYFPNYVIPMLPERLSNELCSLKPHVDRMTLVCEMTVSLRGVLSSYEFYPAIIHSKARLTYTQVADLLAQGETAFPQAYHPIIPDIQTLYQLFKALLAERTERGAIEFEVPEPVVQLDAKGDVLGIAYRSRNDAHRLIEECMLLANVSAARFLLKHGLPALYRVHEPPKDEKVTELRNFLSLLGIRVSNQALKPADFNQIVQQIRERPDFFPLQFTLLRTLTQARYQPQNVGHFGLAYQAYTHFTSPIRRYPDLLVHRAIRYLIDYRDPSGMAYDPDALEALGVHTSAQERKADEASRLVISLLKALYVEQHLGETFQGSISGVTEFGFFVTLDTLMVDGLVHVKNLKDDYYRYQPNRMILLGERSHKSFALGDRVQVKIAKVDTFSGKIDFEWLSSEKNSDSHHASPSKHTPTSPKSQKPHTAYKPKKSKRS